MPERGHIAYDPGGRIFVIADADELLVHDGDTEGPLWRESLTDEIVGVAIAGDEIIAVLDDGTVCRFTFLHRELPRAMLGASVRTFAVRADGTLAAAHAEHVSLLRRNDLAPAPLYHRGVTALAWSADGARLLVAKTTDDTKHMLHLLDGASGEPQGEPRSLAQRVYAIAGSPKGFLVATGDRVVRFTSPEAEPAPVTRAKDQLLTDVACSADGGRMAIQVARSQVVVLADPPADTLLSLEYPQRVCAGLAFGPKPWIGVALGGGDANKCNVDTGALHRSDTHPGRTHQRWIVMVGGAFRAREAAAAKARPPAAAAAPAPGSPEAFERELEKQRELNKKRALQQAEVDLAHARESQDADGRRMIHIGLAVLALLLGLARACSHLDHH